MSHGLHWQKSTFSDGGEGNTCIELAAAHPTLHLRESDSPTTIVATAPTPVAYLLHAITSGRFAPPRG